MKYLAALSALVGMSTAHAIVKKIVVDGNVYPGYDPRYDIDWKQKRIEWGFSSKAAAQGIGPAQNMSSPDMACRFAPVQPPALIAVARAGANVTYSWGAYYQSHMGPVITYMGKLASPTQDPTTVDFFKIYEDGYDTKTHEFGSQRLYANNMTGTVQIPSNLKAGDYIMRHELVALHYAKKEMGPEFYISCLNVKVLGDGTAEPKKEDLVRFPGAYKPDDPYLAFDLHHHENKYIVPGPKLFQAEFNAPKGDRPIVKETGVGSGATWEAYKAIKNLGDFVSESVVTNDDKLNPGGGGCIWEPGQAESTAVCTPINGGHDMVKSPTNARGQFDVKKGQQPKPARKLRRSFTG
ncbi:hypothetical protein BT63DRAFT_63268 [Microthyrium microscopicum]|uniref:lytic cellulose monooxygenase (C4-dehydrogenating) n=1 Tax=Microthyrium microscopicum TaxID=703497 RepID=A0A6A6U196_9PEZI|nr:hypothetical protein BT63DRAFT_63268 [Microthyrium microscopicum]